MCPLRAHVLPSNTCSTLDVHKINILCSLRAHVLSLHMHVQYIGIGNAAGSRHNTTNPTVQRHLTALSDN